MSCDCISINLLRVDILCKFRDRIPNPYFIISKFIAVPESAVTCSLSSVSSTDRHTGESYLSEGYNLAISFFQRHTLRHISTRTWRDF